MLGNVVLPGEVVLTTLGLLATAFTALFHALVSSKSSAKEERKQRKLSARKSAATLRRARYTLERRRGIDSEPPEEELDEEDSGVFDAEALERQRVDLLLKGFVQGPRAADTPRAVPRPQRVPRPKGND